MLSAMTLRVSRRYGQKESFDCYGGLSRFRSLLKKPPFMLSRVEAFLGFFNSIISISDPSPNLCGTPV
jgi:hypothetical protein